MGKKVQGSIDLASSMKTKQKKKGIRRKESGDVHVETID